jgi:hypothetical protein
LDGTIQPEERKYLQQLVEKQGMAEDGEINSLLNSSTVISADECDRWVETYLKSNPDRDNLLTLVSGLIYSDGEVSTDEAKLLTSLQSTDDRSIHPIVDRIRQLYQSAYRKLGN